MYYVFLETRDDDFLKRIAEKNCPQIVNKLVKDYKDYVRQKNGLIDNELLNIYFNDEGKNISFINCFLLLDYICNVEPDCCTNHITVLLSDQIKIVMNVMLESFIKARNDNSNQDNNYESQFLGIGVQRMFQTYMQIKNLRVEELPIPSKYSKKHRSYRRLYISQARKYGKKTDKQGLYYVRIDTKNSDYDDFKKETGFDDLRPCDTIRSVV